MATFILIHGAFHASWCWERIAPALSARGHRVVAPDLPGLGADHTPIAEITLGLWTDFVAQLARQQSEPVILVGHSRGGIVIGEAAERAPECVDELVYLSAFLLPDGKTLLDANARLPRELDPGFLQQTDDGLGMAVNPQFVGSVFYNTTAPEWVARATAMMQREPIVSWTSPVHVTEARFGSIPRSYIECARDFAIPLELQRLMQEDLPCRRVFTLDTDHSPFYSAPELLSRTLCTIAGT